MAPKSKRAKTSKNITLIGGGNSTPIFAALAKKAGHNVSIFTRRPGDWSEVVGFTNEDDGYIDGASEMMAKPDLITSDPSKCVPQADIVFIAGLPVHHNPTVLKQIAPHLTGKTFVGSICAYGGFNWMAKKALGDAAANCEFFGTQLIPWTCGTIKYGERGVVFGAKRMLRIATENSSAYQQLEPVLSGILRIPDIRPTDFLACCMWPNNPSLHPPILYGLFEHWDGKTPYDASDLPVWIYKDLRTNSSKYLYELDQEVQAIVGALSKAHPTNPHLKLDYSLKSCILENYTSQVLNEWDLISTISSNVAFGSHKLAYTEVSKGKVVPTVKHKFFESDLPLGQILWKDLAIMCGIETPLIDRIIVWNQKLIGKDYMNVKTKKLDGKDVEECMVPSRLGYTLETLCSKL